MLYLHTNAHESLTNFSKILFVPNYRIEEFRNRNKNVCAQFVETQYIASQ